MSILQFLGVWNNYLWPLLTITKTSFQPIMVVLPSIKDSVVIFLLFQGWFMSGVVIGAVKE
ncbi:MAG TPA: hypothetical protein VMW65_08265 [Chloroflexota bacterium]|nr:hypothetical protein [Chloroflexota bacterium]